MSHKINSNAMRLGVSKTWKSLWYATGAKYADQLHEDLEVKKYVKKHLSAAGVDDVIISRSAGKIVVNVYVGRPGVAIGRAGAGIEDITKEIRRIVKSKDAEVKINEVKKADLSTAILASEIVSGLQRRMPPKLLALNAITKAKNAGAKGIRVWVSGRINGAQQARVIKFSDGPVPLHTIKADIDFTSTVAETIEYGKFGVKVWVYMPDETDEPKSK